MGNPTRRTPWQCAILALSLSATWAGAQPGKNLTKKMAFLSANSEIFVEYLPDNEMESIPQDFADPAQDTCNGILLITMKDKASGTERFMTLDYKDFKQSAKPMQDHYKARSKDERRHEVFRDLFRKYQVRNFGPTQPSIPPKKK